MHALPECYAADGADEAGHRKNWVIAYCTEMSGANGQGRTMDEARASLGEAIALILEDRCEDGLRGVPPDAERETVTVE